MHTYQHTAQSASDLKQHLYDNEVFIEIHRSNVNWLIENGFIEYTPPEIKMFRKYLKFYKIENDYIYLLLFSSRHDSNEKYYIREKYKLIKSDDLINKLKLNEDIYDDFHQKFLPSNDLKNPSMIMYQISGSKEYIYYDNDNNKKQISYFIDTGRINMRINSEHDFYISSLNFEREELVYIEVMLDGVIQSGEPLKSVWAELGQQTPTVNNLLQFNMEMPDEMKFLFSAVAI